MFPRIEELGACDFGEDADMCGDTLAEVIEDCPRKKSKIFNQQTIRELRTLLSYSDEEIQRASKSVINLNPTAYIDDPPNWGRFPTLRAFWTAVLESFESYIAIQEAERAQDTFADIIESSKPGCKTTQPVPILRKTLLGMSYYVQTSPRR